MSSSNSAPLPGASITLTAAGFCAGATVTFTIGNTTVGSAVTDANGSASIVVNAPTTPGTYTVTATASGACTGSATSAITVTASSSSSLPVTGGGASTTGGLRIGIVAIVLGLGLLGAVSIRRRTHIHA